MGTWMVIKEARRYELPSESGPPSKEINDMNQTNTNSGIGRLRRRIPPLLLVISVAIGLAACGSSGGSGSSGVNTGGGGGQQNTTTTTAPQSGGAGF